MKRRVSCSFHPGLDLCLFLFVCLLAAWSTGSAVRAQVLYGTITGQISDSTGAVTATRGAISSGGPPG